MPFGKEGSEPDVKPAKDSRIKYECCRIHSKFRGFAF